MGVRRLLFVLLAAGPLALLIVYGFVRDIPPSWNCGESAPADSVVDRYRAGAWSLIAGAELVAVSIFFGALGGARDRPSRAVDVTIALVAGASGVGLATAIVSSERAEDLMAGLVPGLVVSLLVWGVLRGVASRPPTWAAGFQAVLIVLGGLPLAYVGGLVAAYAKASVLVVIGVATALMVTLLLTCPSQKSRTAWHSIVVAAGFFAVAVVPAAGMMILSRGHGPPFC